MLILFDTSFCALGNTTPAVRWIRDDKYDAIRLKHLKVSYVHCVLILDLYHLSECCICIFMVLLIIVGKIGQYQYIPPKLDWCQQWLIQYFFCKIGVS